jgi:hypothetical protein
MLNLDTKSIIQSRDILWVEEAYHEWIERKVLQKKEEIDDDDYVIANSKIQEVNDGEEKLRGAQDQNESKKTKEKVYMATCWLESSFNP